MSRKTFQKFGKFKNAEKHEDVWKYVSYKVTYYYDLKPYDPYDPPVMCRIQKGS